MQFQFHLSPLKVHKNHLCEIEVPWSLQIHRQRIENKKDRLWQTVVSQTWETSQGNLPKERQ